MLPIQIPVNISLIDKTCKPIGKQIIRNDYGAYEIMFSGVDTSEFTHGIIKFVRKDGIVIIDNVTISDTVTYTITKDKQNIISVAGYVFAEISFYKENMRITTNRFMFEVPSDIDTDNAINTDNRLPILDNLIIEVQTLLNNSVSGLDSKVDKADGLGLYPIANPVYTISEKNKLANLENYNDTNIINMLDKKVNVVAGMGLSINNYTDDDKNALNDAITNISDLQSTIGNINAILDVINGVVI